MHEKSGDGRGLSERDRFRLEHHEAQVASGQRGKEYGAEHDLSLHVFDQGRKRLRSIGVLPPVRVKCAKTPGASQAVRFGMVAVSAPRAEEPRLRIELTKGSAMEGSGVPEADVIVRRVERLRQLP
jgi:hypothetical protein